MASLLLALKYSEEMHSDHNKKLARLYTKVIRRMDALFTKIELRGWPVHQQEAERVLSDLTIKMDAIQARMLTWLEEHNADQVTWKGPTGKEFYYSGYRQDILVYLSACPAALRHSADTNAPGQGHSLY